MPRDKVAKRFSLSPDLEQFLDMPTTRQAINDFVNAPCPDHWRQRGAFYRVSNVFATTQGTPALHASRHAFCGRNLALGGDTALLLSKDVERDDVSDDPAICFVLANGPHSDWGRRHDAEVEAACRWFDSYWNNDLYKERLAEFFAQDDQSNASNWDLEEEFSAQRETRHLIVLTAHQELTSLYAWLVEWYEGTVTGSLYDATEGLNDDRLALLSTRARGYRYWTRGDTTAYDDVGARRSDAPTEDLIPSCYLSSLYWDFYKLYKQVYEQVIKPARCAETLADGSRCTYAVRVVEGPGPKPTYCLRCIEARKHRQNTERQRKHRTKHSKSGVMPDNA